MLPSGWTFPSSLWKSHGSLLLLANHTVRKYIPLEMLLSLGFTKIKVFIKIMIRLWKLFSEIHHLGSMDNVFGLGCGLVFNPIPSWWVWNCSGTIRQSFMAPAMQASLGVLVKDLGKTPAPKALIPPAVFSVVP